MCIESFEVGSVPLLSFRSCVPFVCIRFCRPLFLLPDSYGFAIGDPCAPTPDQRVAKSPAWACTAESCRSVSVGVPLPSVGKLASSLGHRQTRNRDRLASQGIQPLLDLEEPPWSAWKTAGGERDSRAHRSNNSPRWRHPHRGVGQRTRVRPGRWNSAIRRACCVAEVRRLRRSICLGCMGAAHLSAAPFCRCSRLNAYAQTKSRSRDFGGA
jgi:hypothetical protein